RGPLPRRGRGLASDRRSGRLPWAGRRRPRWPARPVCPDPRSVPQPGSGPSLGAPGRRRGGRARTTGRSWHDPPWRVSTGWLGAGERPSDARHARIREHLAARGASFYREIYTAAGGGTDRDVLDALWDLVWAGEVTNDTFAPLRALRWKRTARDVRRRMGRLSSLGPPEAAGRWSLVDAPTGTATERAHATALSLLDRQGIVTRDGVAGENVEGGFSA